MGAIAVLDSATPDRSSRRAAHGDDSSRLPAPNDDDGASCPSLHPTERGRDGRLRCYHGRGHGGAHGNGAITWLDSPISAREAVLREIEIAFRDGDWKAIDRLLYNARAEGLFPWPRP